MTRALTPNSDFVDRRKRVSDIVIFDEIYMRRYRIVDNRRFGVRIHHIRRPDFGRELHDHPFDFFSIVIKGKYREMLADGSRNWHRFGIPHFRSAETAHMITEVSPRGVWTLVFRGRIRRRWGFYVNDRWVHHSEYEPS